MSDTLELLSADKIKAQYWGQYKMLALKINETLGVLRALGEKGVPPNLSPVQFSDELPLNPVAEPVKIVARREGKSLSQLIRDGANQIFTGITREGLLEYIHSVDPERDVNPSSLSALMSQIAKEEGWILREAGSGGRPSVYDRM